MPGEPARDRRHAAPRVGVSGEGLFDEMHVAIVPVLLGDGEPPFASLDLAALGDRCARHDASDSVPHVIVKRDVAR